MPTFLEMMFYVLPGYPGVLEKNLFIPKKSGLQNTGGGLPAITKRRRVDTAHHFLIKMPTYLRSKTPGGTFFFTVVTFQRRRIFSELKYINILENIIAGVQKEHPFTLEAWVFLPDHMHCLWTMPPDESDYSKRWGMIKARFTKAISPDAGRSALLTGSKIRYREGTVWQRRFWEHQIRDERDLQTHLDYIHFNPVKHGLVKSPGHWPYSSFREFVKRNLYPDNWGEHLDLKFEADFGE